MGVDRERVRGAALFVCFYPWSVLSPMEPEINAPRKRKTTEALTHHLSDGALGVRRGRGKMKTCI